MYQKTILDVETVPHVDIDFMNSTHFEEIEMVDELGKLVSAYQDGTANSDDNAQKISQKLDEWLKHTIPHFERENTLMQKTGFPAFGVHSEEHEIALSRMKNVFEVWKQKKDIDLLADYVFNMWPNWFNGHVNSMDMMTAKFAVMNGFDPQAMA